MAERIAVVGISGAGKSTFARVLGRRTGLPVRHGDQLEWRPDWVLPDASEIEAAHAGWLAEPRWIIEGWMEPDRARRLAAADLVIDLDVSRWLCLARVVKRMLARRRRTEMPEGCIDRFSPRTLATVLFKRERPFIDAALTAMKPAQYVRITSPREARRWLDSHVGMGS
jgi:adenylate kinase family enzyme